GRGELPALATGLHAGEVRRLAQHRKGPPCGEPFRKSNIRHPRVGGNPERLSATRAFLVRWVPAFAGMTNYVLLFRLLLQRFAEDVSEARTRVRRTVLLDSLLLFGDLA